LETWKPVVGYEGIYEVSNLGRVKSLARVKMCGHPGTQQMTKERMLKLGLIVLAIVELNYQKMVFLN